MPDFLPVFATELFHTCPAWTILEKANIKTLLYFSKGWATILDLT